MALSNWATLALHSEDGLVNSEFEHEAGFTVQIYKSKIHIYDEKAFRGGCGFRNNLVMRIESGDCRYFDMRMDVWKPETNEVYLAANKGHRHDDTYVGFAGCGVFGYDGEDWVGVREHQIERLRQHIQESSHVREEDFQIPEDAEYNQGDEVLLESVEGSVDSSELYNRGEEPVLAQLLDSMGE